MLSAQSALKKQILHTNNKNRKNMNCTTANKLSIAGFLTSKGISPAKSNSNSFTYCSPFRNDLVCNMYQVDVTGALLHISGQSPNISPFSFEKQLTPAKSLTIEKVIPLQNGHLIRYLSKRGIIFDLACRYLHEVYYIINDKKRYAIGFKNDLAGYELRCEHCDFKGSSSPKAITTIPGNNDTLNVFEGFMDFLSCLSWFKTDHLKGTTIVLNSLSFLNKNIDHFGQYEKINLFLDNDAAGKEASKRIMAKYPQTINQAEIIYPANKDFNEFLTHQ